MDVALVLFTRDLRVRDNPALAGACARARAVLPLFVADPALAVPPNRARFLAESVAVLREELRGLGGDLVIRRGDPAAEAVGLATRAKAEAVFVAADVSRYAARRTERLARECARHRIALEVTPGHAVTASFPTKTLGIDWRHGYRHFAELLADGDVANNAGNWQWVAGTGNNPRPGRVLNPLRQAERFDRDGGYVRRYVPELASLEAPLIHKPWKLPEAKRRRLGYPGPVTARLGERGLTPRAPA